MEDTQPVHVLGGGLAGSEAAWQLAQSGLSVILHEMRPHTKTDAHETAGLAELVCSNSFRSDDMLGNAVGVLHEELRRSGSLIMDAAHAHQVPAGSALAVDRLAFSQHVEEKLLQHPRIQLQREEITSLPSQDWGDVIIATGPLTSPALSQSILSLTDVEALSFFDAIAPIVYKESIDFDIAWFQSRYDKVGPGGDGADYINCPLEEAQYNCFIQALLEGEKTQFKEWEKDTPYFDGCLPIEVMAERGPETLRHGPMKPIGLTNPHRPEKPYAVVQLRQDNKLSTLYNIVGFQTKLTYGAQKDVFRTIPGLSEASFARLGGIHRNSFLNSPLLLDSHLRLKSHPWLRFAGQITGVEGYVESTAIGLLAGRFIAEERITGSVTLPPETTALGALLRHITGGADAKSFQPMNINFGLFPPAAPEDIEKPEGRRLRGVEKKKARRTAQAKRALRDIDQWLR